MSESIAERSARLKKYLPKTPKTTSADPPHNLNRLPKRCVVTLSNALARAAQGLTLTEKRVVTCCIAQIDSREEYNPKEDLYSSLSAKDYAEQFDVSLHTAYRELNLAVKNLYERSITFAEYGKGSKGKKSINKVKTRWVQQVKYLEQYASIELLWTKAVGAELKGLKGNFTTYQLKHAKGLRSVHSWRMLEYLKSHVDEPAKKDSPRAADFKPKSKTKDGYYWQEISVEDFARMMDATEKQQKDFANIRRRMIEPAVKDLIEKDGWKIRWTAIKPGGKKVSGIRFEFKRDPQGRLFAPQ